MPVRPGTRRIEGRALAAAAAALLLAATGGEAIDLTAKVRARPDLVAALEAGCARICQGNRREARLERVTAAPLGGGLWRIEGEAALRNRHVQPVPAGLGGLVGDSLTLFDHTVRVRGRGRLDARTCLLEVEAVEVADDPLGLARLLDGEVGRRHRVERCAELLPEAGPAPPGAARRRP